jgi:hypothetical protein
MVCPVIFLSWKRGDQNSWLLSIVSQLDLESWVLQRQCSGFVFRVNKFIFSIGLYDRRFVIFLRVSRRISRPLIHVREKVCPSNFLSNIHLDISYNAKNWNIISHLILVLRSTFMTWNFRCFSQRKQAKDWTVLNKVIAVCLPSHLLLFLFFSFFMLGQFRQNRTCSSVKQEHMLRMVLVIPNISGLYFDVTAVILSWISHNSEALICSSLSLLSKFFLLSWPTLRISFHRTKQIIILSH